MFRFVKVRDLMEGVGVVLDNPTSSSLMGPTTVKEFFANFGDPEDPDFSEDDIMNIVGLPHLSEPKRSTAGSAGYDLFVPTEVTFAPGEEKRIFFGWALCMDPFYKDVVVRVLPRSSLYKKGLLPARGPEAFEDKKMLFISLVNYTKEKVTLEANTRIAQAICCSTAGEEVPVEYYSAGTRKLLERPLFNNIAMPGFAKEDAVIAPKTSKLVSLGVAAKFKEDTVLFLYPQRGLPEHYILANAIGVIDSDYFNNPSTHGEIYMNIFNDSYAPLKVNKGDYIADLVPQKIYVDSSEVLSTERGGGFGSTGK